MSVITLPVVKNPSSFQVTSIEWADLSLNLLRALLTRDVWVHAGEIVDENRPGAKLAKAGAVGWFCVKCSEGCRNCYAEKINLRFGVHLNYKAQHLKSGLIKIVLDEQRLDAMLKWKIPKDFKSKVDGSERPKCFPFDMTDLFGDWVSFDLIDRIWAAFAIRRDMDFMVLTKRIERAEEYLNQRSLPASVDRHKCELMSKMADHGRERDAYLGESESGYFENGYLDNVIIMASCEDQKAADKRIPHLMRCPAGRRGVSLEPLIGEIDMGPYTPGMWHCKACGHWMANRYAAVDEGESSPLCGKCNSLNVEMIYLHLVIVGDESGPGRRKSQLQWHRSILYHCDGSGVAFFEKQMEVDGEITGDINKFPVDLQVRQFPKLQEVP